MKWNRIENYPFDSPDRIDSNRFESIFPSSSNKQKHKYGAAMGIGQAFLERNTATAQHMLSSVRLSVRLSHEWISQTRSQAVARIADRTAKNCRGHVTQATPTFRENFCAPA